MSLEISQAHKQLLEHKHALPPELIDSLEASGDICSLSPSEVRSHLGREDIDSSGFLIRYPGNGFSTVRLDNPPIDERGRPRKYLRRAGEPNSLYIPSGLDLAQEKEIWITEGEIKSICGHIYGLSVAALSGVYNWRTSGEEASLLAEGERLSDEESLLPELAGISWEGKKVNLLYDSDITKHPEAREAFPRLAEQLYRLGAGEVRILTLPPGEGGQKQGLDDLILARGPEEALQDLQKIRDRAEPYLPIRDGGLAYAERVIKSEDPEIKLKAVVAYLGAKGEAPVIIWLKAQTGLQSDVRKALLSEAKKKLKELQAKPRASSQAGEDLQLGPEYDLPKALLRATGEYSLDTQGRLCKDKKEFNETTGELEFSQTPLCNFICWPIREILKDSGNGTPERYLELQGLLQDGSSLPPKKISLNDFLEKPNSWPGLTWGVKPALKPYMEKEARYAIHEMARGISETTIFTHIGWRLINGSWIYLHAGGAIGPGSEAVEVEINERLKQYSLPKETGDIKEALKASLSLLEIGPKKIMYPLLASVYLAPLCEPLRQAGIEPSLLSYIWGPSGTKKSTLIALFLCHFGSFDPKGLPASFRDTANSIEKLAFLAKDTILPVDDLYPAGEPKEQAKQEGVLEHLSRGQGDRTARGRMKADTSLREGLPPRGLALCSGEVMHLSGSSLARAFIHKLQKGSIDLEKLTQAQGRQDLLSHAMRGYLEYLAPQMEDLPGQEKEAFIHLRDEAFKKATIKTRHSRLNEAISHLHLGLNAFIKYAVAQGALTQEEGKKFLQEAWEIFNQLADEQALQEQAGEPSKKIAEASLELEAQGRIYWADMEDTPGFLANSVKVGWKDEGKGTFYTNLGTLFKEVNQHLRGQGEYLSLSKADFISYLNQKELLMEKDKGKNQKTIWIKDNTEGKEARKIYAISTKFFEEEGENDE